ncbi:hypothetical protein AB0395_47535 [Streptosporangium sp. NPDC051023]|uniref:hypothetical protein n=1 Tax=Streptosporangium sp. NPDC051023 TaxID=3155410 RepID=UPI00344C0750
MSRFDAQDAFRELSYKAREFTITDIHLKLLREAEVDWDDTEFGAPCIDPKRPYGNSNVPRDIAELLNPEVRDWDDTRLDDYLDQHYDELTRLHVETGLALKICLRRGEFKPGRYQKVNWGKWELVGPVEEASRG